MTKCIIIDNDALLIIKATPTVQQAEYWAELLIPTHDFMITGTDANRYFSAYTNMELRILYERMTGEQALESTSFSDLIKGVRHAADQIPVDNTPVETLIERLGRVLKEVSPLPAKETRKAPLQEVTRTEDGTVKIVSGDKPKRPKEGSSTANVWKAADELYALYQRMPTRQEVIDRAVQGYGVAHATASTQFAAWKKSIALP